MLSCLVGSAESNGIHPQAENRDRKDDNLTLVTIGETLARFCKQIQCELPDEFQLSWCIKN